MYTIITSSKLQAFIIKDIKRRSHDKNITEGLDLGEEKSAPVRTDFTNIYIIILWMEPVYFDFPGVLHIHHTGHYLR